MQSVAIEHPGDVVAEKFMPWINDLVQSEGTEDPALQGHPGLQGRAETVRVPRRAHDARRRRAAGMEGLAKSGRRGSCSSAGTCPKIGSGRSFSPASRDRADRGCSARSEWLEAERLGVLRGLGHPGAALASLLEARSSDPLRAVRLRLDPFICHPIGSKMMMP